MEGRAVRGGVACSAASALALAVLLVAVQLALVLPDEERLPPLAGVGTIERSPHLPGAFTKLSAGFIERALGLGTPLADAAPDTPGPPAVTLPPVADDGRVVVAHGLTNDDRNDAFAIASVPFTARTTTSNATREAEEPAGCSPAGGGTVWYRHRPSDDRALVATTFGSDHMTALAVFVADDGGRLRSLGCDLDPVGAAQVVFTGRAAESYLIQVTAPGRGGHLVFNLDPLGTTRRVSVKTGGAESDGGSQFAALSADGRYVAFASPARELVEGDTNTCPPYSRDRCFDVFVHDTVTRRTERVSVSSSGAQADGPSTGQPAISGDGRYVAFVSLASNLVPDDTNGQWDVFVHDRATGLTERVSVDSRERQGASPDPFANHASMAPPSISLSHDGRYVAFASAFPNLVAPDRNACFDSGIVDWGAAVQHPEPPVRIPAASVAYGCRDVFVRDRRAGTTERVSVASDGAEADGDSASAVISPDGRYVAFTSDAENLDARDRNLHRDAFVHDRSTRQTKLVSLSSSGEQGNASSGGINERGDTSISADARYVTFISHASNLAPGDDTPDQDVFLRDRLTGETKVLPATYDEDPADGRIVSASGAHAAMSADGRFVASSYAVVVVRGAQLHQVSHVLVYDRRADRTTRVSVSSTGDEADRGAVVPDISHDGRVVAFHSLATNLVDDDTNGFDDVFVHENPWAR